MRNLLVIKKFLHKIQHLFGLSPCKVISFTSNGVFYVGAQCQGCGSIDHILKTKEQPETFEPIHYDPKDSIIKDEIAMQAIGELVILGYPMFQIRNGYITSLREYHKSNKRKNVHVRIL